MILILISHHHHHHHHYTTTIITISVTAMLPLKFILLMNCALTQAVVSRTFAIYIAMFGYCHIRPMSSVVCRLPLTRVHCDKMNEIRIARFLPSEAAMLARSWGS